MMYTNKARATISIVLAMIFMLTFSSTCFATGGSINAPRDNTHYLETVTDPEKLQGTFTITYTQMQIRADAEREIQSALSDMSIYPPAAALGKAVSLAMAFGSYNDPYNNYGTFRVLVKNQRIYEVNRLTGKKVLLERKMLVRATLHDSQGDKRGEVPQFTVNIK